MTRGTVHAALVHHPVLNRRGEEVAAALTNLDLHDLPRAARTFGVASVYVVTPVKEQQDLARAIAAHWLNGHGGKTNPERRRAIKLLRLKSTLKEVIEELTGLEGRPPLVVATAANPGVPVMKMEKLKEAIYSERPVLLVFGTASGLSPHIIEGADCVLEPIRGQEGYNHLSVRAAAAIYFDRLLGDRA